jgi:hypothetical protein
LVGIFGRDINRYFCIGGNQMKNKVDSKLDNVNWEVVYGTLIGLGIGFMITTTLIKLAQIINLIPDPIKNLK